MLLCKMVAPSINGSNGPLIMHNGNKVKLIVLNKEYQPQYLEVHALIAGLETRKEKFGEAISRINVLEIIL